MDIFDRAPRYTFDKRADAEEFCRKLREMAYKYDVVTINDILRARLEKTTSEGFHYGYTRKEIRHLRTEKSLDKWAVNFPIPGRLVRDENGYWTTEKGD